jgi:hypothetical protein
VDCNSQGWPVIPWPEPTARLNMSRSRSSQMGFATLGRDNVPQHRTRVSTIKHGGSSRGELNRPERFRLAVRGGLFTISSRRRSCVDSPQQGPGRFPGQRCKRAVIASTDLMQSRLVSLEGARNLRELGGYDCPIRAQDRCDQSHTCAFLPSRQARNDEAIVGSASRNSQNVGELGWCG